jgi:ATP/maltotriose-dependent transcriptional regulator MalT
MLERPALKPKEYFFGDHLTNALAHIYRTPMTVITAPYGYGKDVAVSCYMRAADAATLWFNVPEDAGNGYFWETFRRVFSGANAGADFPPAFICPALPRDYAEMNEFAEALRFALSRQNRNIAVVIDNFQILPNLEAVYRFLRHIAACFLSNFHIVLLSTYYLPVSANDILNGTVKRIGKPMFCLDEEGIRRLFESYGIDLQEEHVAQAADFSEGWLSALSELILTVLERNRFDNAVIDEAKRRMTVNLRDSVWMDLPEVARRFLTIMSVTHEFTLEQAKYICAFSGAGIDADAMLKLLDGRHIIDANEDGSYRTHNLLLALAREEARKLPPAMRKSALRALLEADISGGVAGYPNAAAHLTAREWEVLPLLRAGKKNSEIAQCLYISENTVKSLLKSIYKKLGVHSRKELAE